MNLHRRAGILLHPTSLPGPHGIGTLGQAVDDWLDWLSATGARVWQVLPLGPTGFGDSPYQAFSSFAGNPLLVDLDLLRTDELLERRDLAGEPTWPANRVAYGDLIPWKAAMLGRAHARLTADHPRRAEFEAFVADQSWWLEDYSLFRAIKASHGGRPWHEWPEGLRDREPTAMATAESALALEIDRYSFGQWLFFDQWQRVRAAAKEREIEVFGDIPLYVAHDSSDVWANRELFALDAQGGGTEVAGVPPDYFSPTGQLWGNPIYDWPAHAASGHAWWAARVRAAFALVDVVRIDHFRGFADYWAIPGDAPTAETGEWRQGPGRAFFDTLAAQLGELPIVAEDLGDLSPAVYELRDELGLPGMKILQFAFDGEPDNPFLPEAIGEKAVVYTGTHDNDTTRGWFASVPPAERQRVIEAIGHDGAEIWWTMIETAWATKAYLAIAPLQDVLGLPGSERMNTPGTAGGNWQWRMERSALAPALAARLRALNQATGRMAG